MYLGQCLYYTVDHLRLYLAIIVYRNFEAKGVGVLSLCHQKDETKAAILLIREIPIYGNTTILKLVAEAKVDFAFITHAATQALVQNIWMGRLSMDTSTGQVLYMKP